MLAFSQVLYTTVRFDFCFPSSLPSLPCFFQMIVCMNALKRSLLVRNEAYVCLSAHLAQCRDYGVVLMLCGNCQPISGIMAMIVCVAFMKSTT